MAQTSIVVLSGTNLNESTAQVDDATGLMTLSNSVPINPDHVASKEYVDGKTSGLTSTAALATALATKSDISDMAAAQATIAAHTAALTLTATQADLDAALLRIDALEAALTALEARLTIEEAKP